MNPSLIGAFCFAGFALAVVVASTDAVAITATMAATLNNRFFDIVRPFRYTDLTADQLGPLRRRLRSPAVAAEVRMCGIVPPRGESSYRLLTHHLPRSARRSACRSPSSARALRPCGHRAARLRDRRPPARDP